MIKAIFFDWGHTITTNGFRDAREKISNLLKPYNLTWDDFYQHFRNLYEIRSSGHLKSDDEMFNLLGKITGKENLPSRKILEAVVDSTVIPQENIKIIEKLKEKYKVGLLTNNVREWLEPSLKRYKIENLFDAIITSSEVGAKKPDAKIYYAALKSLSVKPEETIFVSDELSEDLIAAKGCGIKTIWLDLGNDDEWNKKEREIARTFKPDAIVGNLREVIPLLKDL
jgi:putative hydrolase of the HAD superfamily